MGDVRYGIRLLLKSPAFTVIALLTLALAIGASTSIFSVVNAVLMRELPYRDPDRLVLIWGAETLEHDDRGQISYTDMEDWRSQSHAFEKMAAYGTWTAILSSDSQPERIAGMIVTADYFDVLKVSPLLGRLFLREEQIDGKDNEVLLSYALWQRRFEGDPNISGKKITLNSQPYLVVGVMPKDFRSLPRELIDPPAEIYRPAGEPYSERGRSSRHLRGIARLKSNASLKQAQAELDVLARLQQQAHPDTNANREARVIGMHDDIVRRIRTALWILQASVLVVVLIACANLANLLLARSAVRRREIAIRAALGASRMRLVRQMLTESILLAIAGGLAGAILAQWGIHFLASAGAKTLPELSEIRMDGAVLIFTAVVSLFTGMIFGLAPALQLSSFHLSARLADSGRTSAASARGRARNVLIVSEVALTLVLLASAGLLVKSFVRLRGVNPGFDPRNNLTMNITLPFAKYNQDAKQVNFYRELIGKVERMPGVQSAGLVSILPESTNFDTTSMRIRDKIFPRGESPYPDRYVVTPGYFRATSIPLVRGRLLAEQDNSEHALVVLVNETLARTIWPGEDAIGKNVKVPTGGRSEEESPWRTVVGVVGDVYQYGLDGRKTPQFYLPHAQYGGRYMTLVVHAADPLRLIAPIRSAVLAIDPDQPVHDIATMDEVLSESYAGRRFSMLLLAIFAAGALVLASLGIYGMLSYAVAQRTQEIGLRMALGAGQADVLRTIIGGGFVLVLIGLGVGTVGALALTRVMRSLLFGVSVTDAGTFIAVSLLLMAVAMLASYLPARRAMRVDPMVALRYE